MFQVVSTLLQKIDINGRGLFSLCELDVQRKCSEWTKLATTNFRGDIIMLLYFCTEGPGM